MSRKNIRKFSWSYELVRKLTVLYHRLYYRKLKMIYREKIPVNKPVIFALNHQNALMDPLSVVYTLPGQSVFMARADIFRKKWIARLLYFLKILPAYRIRDGFHSVDQNKEVFKEVISVLENNGSMGLFPEGSHLGEKRLRPLKKGAARLALLAEEANGFSHDVFIVPVGLDYSNYYNAGSDLLIVIGDPISSSAYREQYLENPVTAINNLTNDLAGEMKKVMINIDSEEHYQTIRDAVMMYFPIELKKQKLRFSLWNNFRIKKELSEKITSDINSKEKQLLALKQDLDQYHAETKKFKLRDQQISNPFSNPVSLFIKSCISLILLPLHLYGMILNYLPYRIPIYLTRKIKDPHFISSIRWGTGILTFIPWHLLTIILSFIIFNQFLLGLVFIISLPLTGIFTFYHYKHLKKLRADFRWMWMRYNQRAEFEGMMKKRSEIIVKIQELITK
jgi:1-acyl-sn-glycerol-3-phosphate acyltransferase